MKYRDEWNGSCVTVYTDDENYKAEITVYVDYDSVYVPGTVCDFKDVPYLEIEDVVLYAWDVIKEDYVPMEDDDEGSFFKEMFGEFDIEKSAKEEGKRHEDAMSAPY